jgi:hypothetical protein
MGMVAPERRIACAYVICFGVHGDVTRWVHEWSVSR